MCQGFTTREETTGYEGLHCEYRYIRRSRRTLGGYLLQKRSSYLLRFIWKTTRRGICSTIYSKYSTRWIHNKECLQSPWSKVCGMWCIYIIHQLNKGLDLNTAIHQELYGTGEDLYQNDRDIGMWFSYNYARVILSQNGMRRMTPPDFLFKHRIQTCKCHNYSHHLSKKYPKYNML